MSKIALCDANGLLSNLYSNLAGKNGDEWMEILRRTLRRQNPFELPTKLFEPTFTNSIQDSLSNDLLDEVERKFGLNHDVRELLEPRDIRFAAKQEQIVILSIRDLGFEDVVKLRSVYARAESFGLETCSWFAPVWALMQHADQLEGKFVHFAMEPLGRSTLATGKLNTRPTTGNSYGDTFTLYPMECTMSTTCAPSHLWAFKIPNKK